MLKIKDLSSDLFPLEEVNKIFESNKIVKATFMSSYINEIRLYAGKTKMMIFINGDEFVDFVKDFPYVDKIRIIYNMSEEYTAMLLEKTNQLRVSSTVSASFIEKHNNKIYSISIDESEKPICDDEDMLCDHFREYLNLSMLSKFKIRIDTNYPIIDYLPTDCERLNLKFFRSTTHETPMIYLGRFTNLKKLKFTDTHIDLEVPITFEYNTMNKLESFKTNLSFDLSKLLQNSSIKKIIASKRFEVNKEILVNCTTLVEEHNLFIDGKKEIVNDTIERNKKDLDASRFARVKPIFN